MSFLNRYLQSTNNSKSDRKINNNYPLFPHFKRSNTTTTPISRNDIREENIKFDIPSQPMNSSEPEKEKEKDPLTENIQNILNDINKNYCPIWSPEEIVTVSTDATNIYNNVKDLFQTAIVNPVERHIQTIHLLSKLKQPIRKTQEI